MTTQQAYIEGFVKRAASYGYNQQEALYILKQASPETLNMSPAALSAEQAGQGPMHTVSQFPPDVSAINPAMARRLNIPTAPGDAAYYGTPAPAVKPAIKIDPAHMHDAVMQPGQRSFTRLK